MNVQEKTRLVSGLRSAGWTEKQIHDFILYMQTGDEIYRPQESQNRRITMAERERNS